MGSAGVLTSANVQFNGLGNGTVEIDFRLTPCLGAVSPASDAASELPPALGNLNLDVLSRITYLNSDYLYRIFKKEKPIDGIIGLSNVIYSNTDLISALTSIGQDEYGVMAIDGNGSPLFVLLFFLVRTIFSPIAQLTSILEKTLLKNTGRLEIPILPDRKDEIGTLIHSFNAMQKRIATLIDEIYVQKLKAKEYQLNALRADHPPFSL